MERAQLEQQGLTEGWLTPDLVEQWRNRPYADLVAAAWDTIGTATPIAAPGRIPPEYIRDVQALYDDQHADQRSDAQRYASMKPLERARLRKSDPATFERLHAAAKNERIVR